jgi:hypothetical protein
MGKIAKEKGNVKKDPKKKKADDKKKAEQKLANYSKFKQDIAVSKEKNQELDLSNTEFSFNQLLELSAILKQHTAKISKVILTGNKFVDLQRETPVQAAKIKEQIKSNLEKVETKIIIKTTHAKSLAEFFSTIECIQHSGVRKKPNEEAKKLEKKGAQLDEKNQASSLSKKDEKSEKVDKIDSKNEQSSSDLSKVDSSDSSNKISDSKFLKSVKAKLSSCIDVITSGTSDLKEKLKSIEVSQILLGKVKDSILGIKEDDLIISVIGDNDDDSTS